jgi:hypothetical protein
MVLQATSIYWAVVLCYDKVFAVGLYVIVVISVLWPAGFVLCLYSILHYKQCGATSERESLNSLREADLSSILIDDNDDVATIEDSLISDSDDETDSKNDNLDPREFKYDELDYDV